MSGKKRSTAIKIENNYRRYLYRNARACVCKGIIVKQLKINMKEKIKMKWDSREKQNVGFKS